MVSIGTINNAKCEDEKDGKFAGRVYDKDKEREIEDILMSHYGFIQ